MEIQQNAKGLHVDTHNQFAPHSSTYLLLLLLRAVLGHCLLLVERLPLRRIVNRRRVCRRRLRSVCGCVGGYVPASECASMLQLTGSMHEG